MSVALPLVCTLPWILPPVIGLLRARHASSLDDVSAAAPKPAPLVSVIIPARNEARNIVRCVTSVLASRYPSLEVIVVDDQSIDGTGKLARALGAADSRLRVMDAPPLPPGWFGKQWACATGASAASGELLVFTDADTRHAPELVTRAVNARETRHADLLSVAGYQEMRSFWERIIQPQVFALLSLRYGGPEHVNQARRAEDVIANGQFILVTREAYVEMGGHDLVRDRVAEDLAMAQEFFRAGRRVVLILGLDQLSTHMYASLKEVIGGWRKNIYAGGRYAMVGGALGRALFPILLLALPLFGLAPPVALALSLFGVVAGSWPLWSATIVAVTVLFWTAIYRFMKVPPGYALLYPIGLLLLLYIAAGAVVRGRRVQWKARTYVSG